MAALSEKMEGVEFDQSIDGTTVTAVVLGETLMRCFGATRDPATWLAVYHEHEVEVRAAAQRSYRPGHRVVIVKDWAIALGRSG